MCAPPVQDQAARLIAAATARGVRLRTAESCTGGLVASALTSVAGSSSAVDRGWVTYSNAAKTDLLGVPEAVLRDHGAVSEAMARAMAEGATRGEADVLAVSVTGVAGPGGGSIDKPVGLVWFATALNGRIVANERRFGDLGRDGVRQAALETGLDLLEAALADSE